MIWGYWYSSDRRVLLALKLLIQCQESRVDTLHDEQLTSYYQNIYNILDTAWKYVWFSDKGLLLFSSLSLFDDITCTHMSKKLWKIPSCGFVPTIVFVGTNFCIVSWKVNFGAFSQLIESQNLCNWWVTSQWWVNWVSVHVIWQKWILAMVIK